jgi:transcriptional regulator with XRE-family HTH domain
MRAESSTAKTSPAAARRRQLSEFLVARRASLSPGDVGLAQGVRRRRTPGLRREEVAALAGVGITWYTWLEQGRDIRVSAETLERIAVALRLSASDSEYLYALAEVPRSELHVSTERVDAHLQEVVDGFRAGPAIVVTSCWDVEAFNRIADRIFHFEAMQGRYSRNHLWRLFMDPARRAIYEDWRSLASLGVGALRLVSASRPDDDYFQGLIRDLLDSSEDFRRLWRGQHTAPLTTIEIRMTLREGDAVFRSHRFRSVESDDRLLIVLTPVDATTEAVVRRLAAEESE